MIVILIPAEEGLFCNKCNAIKSSGRANKRKAGNIKHLHLCGIVHILRNVSVIKEIAKYTETSLRSINPFHFSRTLKIGLHLTGRDI